MKFTKMHGAGNDYVYINCFAETVEDPETLAVSISDRHFGVGGDGMVLIMPSSNADARMRMFNSDGSEAEMCGNAIRCVGKYLYDHQIVCRDNISIETKSGIKQLSLLIKEGTVYAVTVDMGKPILEAAEIPVLSQTSPPVAQQLTVNGRTYEYSAVSMGNPHCVIFVPEITDEMVLVDGPAIEIHSAFPQKTNVEFVRVDSRKELTMRVWERGSGETWACGTGACATLVAAILNEKSDTMATIHLRGGDLAIAWNLGTRHVAMTGPAVQVFEGDFEIK